MGFNGEKNVLKISLWNSWCYNFDAIGPYAVDFRNFLVFMIFYGKGLNLINKVSLGYCLLIPSNLLIKILPEGLLNAGETY